MNEDNTTANIPDVPVIKSKRKFAGLPCFDCPSKEFHMYRTGKKLKARWDYMLGDSDFGKALTKHVRDNKIEDFIIQNKGVMMKIRRAAQWNHSTASLTKSLS